MGDWRKSTYSDGNGGACLEAAAGDHAILVRHGRHFRILDNRSANGTFVNGRQIVATNLTPGDVIELGPVRFQFVEVA